jgi:hypothetical protein
MSKLLCSLVFLCFTALCFAGTIDPYKGAQPIAVLIQTNPWLMVIGSDTPRVVIYDDGEVVYLQTGLDNGSMYMHKLLTPSELEEVKEKLSSFGDYSAVQRHYDLAPNITDQPESMIYLNLGSKAMVSTIYGLRESMTKLPAHAQSSGGRPPDTMPNALRQLYEYLVGLKFPDAKPWQSKYVEVIVWPYSYAPDQSIHWPKDWPGLESPEAFKRGDSYSIFLPASDIQRLKDFLKTRKQKGAVEIGGKKWAVEFRYVFPSEPVWAMAFR